MKERLIEQEEFINPFEGFNDSEIYGGPSATSQASSSRTRSQSDLVSTSGNPLFGSNLVVPKLDIKSGLNASSNTPQMSRISNISKNNGKFRRLDLLFRRALPIVEKIVESDTENIESDRDPITTVTETQRVTGEKTDKSLGGSQFDPAAFLNNPLLGKSRRR